MIEARHTSWAEWIFVPYLNHLFRRHFHSVRLLGDIPETDVRLPILLLPNHSTWWDGFFVHFLNRNILKREIYLMMLESQLSRFRFFSRLGAFGIEPGKSSGIRSAISYSADILGRHSNEKPVMLCMFPQGELQPWCSEKMDYKSGFISVINRYGGQVTILQLGIKALFLGEEYPEVYFKFNTPELASDSDDLKAVMFIQKHQKLLTSLDEDIQRGERGRILFKGRESLSTKKGQSGR